MLDLTENLYLKQPCKINSDVRGEVTIQMTTKAHLTLTKYQQGSHCDKTIIVVVRYESVSPLSVS